MRSVRSRAGCVISDPAREPRPRAVVTGAGRGLGLALAISLADAGYDLVLCARSEAALDRASQLLAARAGR